MIDLLKTTLLYDFYGELLTEKQKLVFEMYHQNDLSLSEIGEELSISRQAVRDLLNRTQKILQDYEDKLELVYKFNVQKSLIKKIKSTINNIQNFDKLPSEISKEISYINSITDEILC